MPKHIVIDGSNLATEGRSMPSLRQLVEAVQAFMAEHPTALLTVVVDATFGHRIDPREVPEFDAAIDHNELVAPPAGAVGRGDAFVLAIADKVDATILSNDSYQEFHGEYPWLFDDGRLIGGKPVPNVGWVFVPRVPVRGPLSRRSQRDAKERGRSEPSAPRRSKAASLPPPVPLAPPPGAVVAAAKGRGRGRAARAPETSAPVGSAVETGNKRPSVAVPAPAAKTDVPTPARSTMINDLLPFLGFVEHHPVGSVVQAVVESYSSHGAYVTIGDVRAYIPLRFMADPPPRSAREAMKLHDEVSLVVVGFHAQRRGIDLAAPELAASITGLTTDEIAVPATAAKRTRKSTKASAAAPAVTAPAAAAHGEPLEKPVKATTARKRAAKTPIDEGGTPASDAADAAAAVPKKAAKRTPSGRAKKAAAEPSATEPSTTAPDVVGEPVAAAVPPPGPSRRRGTKAAAAAATDTPMPTPAPTSTQDPAPIAPPKRSGASSAKRAAGTTKRVPARSSKVTEPAPNASPAPAAAPAAKTTTRSRSKKAAAPA